MYVWTGEVYCAMLVLADGSKGEFVDMGHDKNFFSTNALCTECGNSG